MKCPKCNHVSLEEAPKFCSECGSKMSSPAEPQAESQPSSNIPHGTNAEITDLRSESEMQDNQNSNVSPKRPNEDANLTPQKQKKKKKKKKAGKAPGPLSLTTTEEKMDEEPVSDSDRSSCAGHDTDKPPESSSDFSQPEHKSIDAAKGDQQSEKAKVEPKRKGQMNISTGAQSTLDQNANIKSNQRDNDGPDAEAQKRHCSNGQSQVKAEKAESEKHDQSGSTDIQHGSPSKKNLNQESQKSSQRMVFGPESILKENDGFSGNSSVKMEHSQKNTQGQRDAPPERNPPQTPHITSSDRLTIYFHAVLSKDFKFNLDEDHVFLRAGGPIGDWKNDLVELSVSQNLDVHGFLIEGKYVCKKTTAEAVSIPYKYVVYNAKKEKYEFEYIYKLDSKDTSNHTNRCLFVKSGLLNAEGEWHQYDDIICTEPSKIKQLKNFVWREQRNGIIKGREIAGGFMLETIFDLLRNWSKVNISNFLSQLKQFYEVYGNPFVYEEKEKKWDSLDYGKKDVSNLLKQFMLERVTPEVQKDSEKKSSFIQDSMKAALILLYVWKQYRLELDNAILSRLCTVLSLPKLPKDDFLSYWTDITESFSEIKNFSEIVESLIQRVRASNMSKWILVIPLMHFLKGNSKPFEPVFNKVNTQYGLIWAGLQGSKSSDLLSLTGQDRRAMFNLMKTHKHLVEVDRLLARSWMYLLTVDELMECSSVLNVELLDIPQVVSDILAYMASDLLDHRWSCLNEAYGIQCIQAACKLLEKICTAVKSYRYSQNFTEIPVACMNLVAAISRFAQTTQEVDHFSEKIIALLNEAKKTSDHGSVKLSKTLYSAETIC